MLSVGFEPTISSGERPQIYVLDHAATGTGLLMIIVLSKLITQKKLYPSEFKKRLVSRTLGENNVKQCKVTYRSEHDIGSGITKRTVECSWALSL
jgi:hypothetical protein